MRAVTRALLLAGLHAALILGLYVKLRVDRARCPRYWLKAAPVDPELPIRGRYVSVAVEVPVTGTLPALEPGECERERIWVGVRLVPGPGWLSAEIAGREAAGGAVQAWLPGTFRDQPPERRRATLVEPLAFFIPERAPDPSRRAPGEELWVEATLPRRGPLRPIRLAVRDGVAFRLLTP